MYHKTPADLWRTTQCWLHHVDEIIRLEAGVKKLQECKNGGFEKKGLLTECSSDFIAAAGLQHPKGFSYMGYLFLILSMPNKAFEYFRSALLIDPFEIDARKLMEHLQKQAKELEILKQTQSRPFETEESNVWAKEDPVPALLEYQIPNDTFLTPGPVPEPLLTPQSEDGLETFWKAMPTDVVTEIFSLYIAPPQLSAVRLVCKQFRDWVEQPTVWVTKLLGRFHNGVGEFSTKLWFSEEKAKKIYMANHADFIGRLQGKYQESKRVMFGFVATDFMLTSASSGIACDPEGIVHSWGRIKAEDGPFTPLGKPFASSAFTGTISLIDATTHGFVATYRPEKRGLELMRCNIDDPDISATNFHYIERWHQESEEPIIHLHIHRCTGCVLVETSNGALKSFDSKTGELLWTLPHPAYAGTKKLSISQIITKMDDPLINDAFVLYSADGQSGSFIAHVDTTTGQIKSHCEVEPTLEIRSLEWCQDFSLLVAATNQGVYVWTSTSPPTPKGILIAGDMWCVRATAWQVMALRPSAREVSVLPFSHHSFSNSPIKVDLAWAGSVKHGLCSESQDDFAICQSDRFVQYSNKKPDWLAAIMPL